MPGGNPTITKTQLDLDSFLKRKNKSLESWLSQTGISSEESLHSLLLKSEWSISEQLLESIRLTFVKPSLTTPESSFESVVSSETSEPEEDLSILSESESSNENLGISDETVILTEEANPENQQLVQLTHKERKKNR